MTKLFSAVLLVTTIAIVSCKGKSGKELIVNKWKLTEISGEAAKDLKEDEKKSMFSSYVMELTKDGKRYMTDRGVIMTGTYELSDDGKTLTLKGNGGEIVETDIIHVLNADKLVISDSKSNIILMFSSK